MKTLPITTAILCCLTILSCSQQPEPYSDLLQQKIHGLEKITPPAAVQDSLYNLIKNQPEPGISVFDTDGNALDLDAVKGKIVNIRLDYYRNLDNKKVQAIVIRKATKQETKTHLKAVEEYRKNPVGAPPRGWRSEG